MNLLFLDTYYVDGIESSIDLYNVSKDFILPSIILAGTIIGSIRLAKKQLDDQKKLEFEKNKEEDESTLKLILLTNHKLIENLKSSIKNFEETIKLLTIDSSGNLPIHIFNDAFFISLTSLGYFKIYEILKNYRKSKDDQILSYWSWICYITKTYKIIQSYNKDLLKQHNKLTDKLNVQSHLIITKSSELIQHSYPPGKVIMYPPQQIKSDPIIRLSTFVKRALDKFITDTSSSHLRKTKTLFEDLDNLKKDSVIASILNIQYAQNISDALGIYKSIENLDYNAQKSYKNYIKTFKKVIEDIEKVGYTTETNS